MNLSHLTLAELRVLQDAYTASASLFVGFLNRPCCEATGVASILEDEVESADRIVTLVVREVASRRPISRDDCRIRARILATAALDAEEWAAAMTAIVSVVPTSDMQLAGERQ